MAIDNKYGSINIPGIPDSEPVFVLRAQDALAVPTILHYAAMVRSLGRLDDKMPEELRVAVRRFTSWTEAVKLPD